VFFGRSDEIEGNQVGKAISKSRCETSKAFKPNIQINSHEESILQFSYFAESWTLKNKIQSCGGKKGEGSF